MEPWLAWRLNEVPAGNLQTVLAAAAGAGVFYCFLGYRLFRWALGLTGFLVAGSVALILAGWLSAGHLATMAVVAFLGGICGAAALVFLYRAGVFFLGFIGTLLIAYNVLQNSLEPWAPWAIVGAALVGGLLALLIERPVMTLVTACLGAYVTVFALTSLVIEQGWDKRLAAAGLNVSMSWGMLAGWFVLTAVGAALQFRLAKGASGKKN